MTTGSSGRGVISDLPIRLTGHDSSAGGDAITGNHTVAKTAETNSRGNMLIPVHHQVNEYQLRIIMRRLMCDILGASCLYGAWFQNSERSALWLSQL